MLSGQMPERFSVVEGSALELEGAVAASSLTEKRGRDPGGVGSAGGQQLYRQP